MYHHNLLLAKTAVSNHVRKSRNRPYMISNTAKSFVTEITAVRSKYNKEFNYNRRSSSTDSSSKRKHPVDVAVYSNTVDPIYYIWCIKHQHSATADSRPQADTDSQYVIQQSCCKQNCFGHQLPSQHSALQ